MDYQVFFPRGVATGRAFCNREEERARIKNNIEHRQHTLLMSPRRYGKTSLVRYAINELKAPFAEADLFVAVDAERIEHIILTAVNAIIQEVSTSLESALLFLTEHFKRSDKQWNIGTKNMKLVLTSEKDSDPASNILEALDALENLLKKKKKLAVLFIDEVQEIGEIAEGKGIEGAIRHVAQQTKYLTLVFSGSQRHLLSQMFYDKARPLYKLCDRITLERIQEVHYKKHINLLARKRWSKVLPDEVLAEIFSLTQYHPFYINGLCSKLWTSALKAIPTVKHVNDLWEKILEEERLEIIRELDSLSAGQKKVLISVAGGYNIHLTGKAFLQEVNMTSSSVVDALKTLEKKDYLQKQEDNTYTLVDPLIKAGINRYFKN